MSVGTPDHLAADLGAYAAEGVAHLALRFWTIDPDPTVHGVIDQMRLWQDLVVATL